MTTAASSNRFKGVTFQPQATPSTPAANDGRLFLDTADGLLKWIDDAGTVTAVALGSVGLSDPMTTRGDIIIRNAANATARLGRGSAGTVLTSDGTDVSWQPAASGAMATDALWDAAGDLAVGTGANTGAKLPIGTAGQFLTVASGTAAWVSPTQYAPPLVSNQATNFSSSTTSLAATMTAPTAGDCLIAVIYSTGRGANSITQTNVTWTQRYTGNGNSQWLEIWTAAVSASAGTTATAAFTGANKAQIDTFVISGHAAMTAAAIVGSSVTSAGATILANSCNPAAAGDYIIAGYSRNGPTSSYGAMSHSYNPILGGAGGQGTAYLFRAHSGLVSSVWTLSSSSVAQFSAFVKVS